jgi:hypothetical protein
MVDRGADSPQGGPHARARSGSWSASHADAAQPRASPIFTRTTASLKRDDRRGAVLSSAPAGSVRTF